MRRLRFALLTSASLASALAACGGSTTDTSGGSGSGGAPPSGGAGAGSGGKAGTTGTGGSSSGGASGGSTSGGASGGSGTTGFDAGAPPTGCSPTRPCSADEYCDYPYNRCGRDGELGRCKNGIAPPGCGLGPPTCGCNGKYYASECLAHLGGLDSQGVDTEGVDADSQGSCMAPPGEFLCGPTFCVLAESYCQRQVTDVRGVPDSFTCQPLPTPCVRSMACACLAQVYCGERCEENVDGGMTVTCPGG